MVAYRNESASSHTQHRRQTDDSRSTQKFYMDEYGVGCDLFICICSYSDVNDPMALADEYRCSLVFHDVQLVYMGQHICAWSGPPQFVCDLFKKPWIS